VNGSYNTTRIQTNPDLFFASTLLGVEGSGKINTNEGKWWQFFNSEGRKWRKVWSSVWPPFMPPADITPINNALDEAPPLNQPKP